MRNAVESISFDSNARWLSSSWRRNPGAASTSGGRADIDRAIQQKAMVARYGTLASGHQKPPTPQGDVWAATATGRARTTPRPPGPGGPVADQKHPCRLVPHPPQVHPRRVARPALRPTPTEYVAAGRICARRKIHQPRAGLGDRQRTGLPARPKDENGQSPGIQSIGSSARWRFVAGTISRLR